MSSALGLGARVVCVFALLAAVLWVLRRTDALGSRRTAPLQVLSTTRLSKSATLSVVRVHDEEHVLAVTGSGVTVVSSRPLPVEDPAADGATATAAAGPVAAPTAAAFLRGGWRVLRSRAVTATVLADDEVTQALAQACTPADSPAARPGPTGFADDLAAALAAVDAVEPTTDPGAEPALVPSPAPRRARREVRPPHARPARRRALRLLEDGAA